MVTRQAQIIAYIDDYKLLMIATLAVIPLLIVFKSPSGGAPRSRLPSRNDLTDVYSERTVGAGRIEPVKP